LCCYLFFVSSRRRHTISKRDWSSDVCSSDLFGLDLRPCGFGVLAGPAQARQRLQPLGARLGTGSRRRARRFADAILQFDHDAVEIGRAPCREREEILIEPRAWYRYARKTCLG